jgi:hypothetical protein
LALNDPLADNSLGYFWSEKNDSAGSCGFSEGAYHVLLSQQGQAHYCPAGTTNFSDFAYEVQTTIVQGEQSGIVFRVNNTNHTFYFFHIDNQGNYALDIYNQNVSTTLLSDNTPINSGSGQSNILAVVVNGSQIVLYMNYLPINNIIDTTYSQGEVGVAVSDSTNPTSAIFTNAKVWTF